MALQSIVNQNDAQSYAGKQFPSKSDFDFDDRSLAAIRKVPGDDMRRKGAIPTQYIFDRAVCRRTMSAGGSRAPSHGKSGGDTRIFTSAYTAAEELVSSISGQYPNELDTIALANDIAYYAEGVDVYYSYTWKWGDGRGDLIERIYSAAEIEARAVNDAERSVPYSPPISMSYVVRSCEGILGRLKSHLDENEPFTIFGLSCTAPRCGKGSVL